MPEEMDYNCTVDFYVTYKMKIKATSFKDAREKSAKIVTEERSNLKEYFSTKGFDAVTPSSVVVDNRTVSPQTEA